MTVWRPDPSFYPSPRMAMEAPPERSASCRWQVAAAQEEQDEPNVLEEEFLHGKRRGAAKRKGTILPDAAARPALQVKWPSTHCRPHRVAMPVTIAAMVLRTWKLATIATSPAAMRG